MVQENEVRLPKTSAKRKNKTTVKEREGQDEEPAIMEILRRVMLCMRCLGSGH
jgi:hypothetical protein